MAFVDLLGFNLRQPNGETGRTRDLLEEKEVVAFYFSADWCPPCSKFTSHLSKLYREVYKDKGMEVVFVSSDCDTIAFCNSHAEMPWLALPFSERMLKDKLGELCKVSDLPALVLLTPEGEIYNYDARKTVGNVECFPWIPKTMQELLAGPFTGPGPKYSIVNRAALSGRYIGLYFSALWCNPCKSFAPKLAETYRKIKMRNPMKFEIVYVSCDMDEEQFAKNFKYMPWLALPFAERVVKDDLRKLLDVQTLPALVILGQDHKEVINENAKESVEADADGYDFPWKRKNAVDRFVSLVKCLQEGGTPLRDHDPEPPKEDQMPNFPWFVQQEESLNQEPKAAAAPSPVRSICSSSNKSSPKSSSSSSTGIICIDSDSDSDDCIAVESPLAKKARLEMEADLDAVRDMMRKFEK